MSSSTLKVLLPALAAAFISWTLSAYIHYPTVQGSTYSDVVSFWYREPELAAGLKPCIDYFFEYPPAACFINYAARLLGGHNVEGYYTAFALLSLPAFLLLAYSMYRLAGWVYVALALSPSLIIYGVYNYDHFMAALTALALVLYLSGRKAPAYVLLGAAASVKIFTVFLLPVLLSERFRWRYVLLFLAGTAPATLPVVLLNPAYVGEFVNYHASWGLENAWTVWLIDDPFSPSAKVIGWLTASILFVRSLISRPPVERRCLLALSGFLLGSPIFTPQMVVMLLPLLAMTPSAWVFIPFIEAANTGIILTWFWVDNPTHAWTPPQTMALVRAIALAAAWVAVYRQWVPPILSNLFKKNILTIPAGQSGEPEPN
jgi:hypothetical protein